MIVLREFREEAGLSQKELAERSSVTQQMISMIENNERKNPGADVLYKLACALGRTMNELYVPDRKEGEQRDAG